MFTRYFPPDYSGAAKQAVAVARELRRRGHSIDFVAVRHASLPQESEYDGFRVTRIYEGAGNRHRELSLWRRLVKLLWDRRGSFDVLHSHGAYYTNAVVGPLGRLFGVPSLVKASLAGDDLAGLGISLSGRVHAKMLSLVDRYVAISGDLVREMKAMGLDERKIVPIPNGVEIDRFRRFVGAERSGVRAELDLPQDRSIVLSVGVLDERKNMGWLAEEWVKSKGFGTGAMLALVGPRARSDVDGSYYEACVTLEMEAPHLLRVCGGASRSIEKYFGVADVFVLPSLNEGLPNVLLEAMASSLPCVVTNVSGSMDVVTEGGTGWLFPVGNALEMGDRIRRAMGKDGREVGMQARGLIERRFSINRVGAQYENTYKEMCSESQLS